LQFYQNETISSAFLFQYKITRMISPVQLSITLPDGSSRKLIVEPVLKRGEDNSLQNTGEYKLYKDAFGDETTLFTEPLEIDETGSSLPDDQNPDYLGKITILNSVEWEYNGDLLNNEEILQVLKYIK